mmetsp:Transcript_145724/g.254364  ORF Transcript_145724/g.254364 Transcript_145724/m.254364 type:complete len:270 (-) Transcript_145724:5040-5849(-)
MLPKGLWRVDDRQGADVLLVGGNGAVHARDHVLVVFGQLVLLDGHSIGVEVLADVHTESPAIPIICHAAPIRGVTDEVPDRVPGDARHRPIGHLIQVELQDVLADLPVGVVEVVGDGHAQGAELPPLQQDGVVEAEAEQQRAVQLRVLGFVEARVSQQVVQAHQVRLEPRGRLRGHLDAHLQDGDGELLVGRGAEPQPEVVVRLLRGQVVDDLLQLRQPAEHQVAVRKEDPATRLGLLRHQAGGQWGLPLAEGQGLQVATQLVCQSQQL